MKIRGRGCSNRRGDQVQGQAVVNCAAIKAHDTTQGIDRYCGSHIKFVRCTYVCIGNGEIKRCAYESQ